MEQMILSISIDDGNDYGARDEKDLWISPLGLAAVSGKHEMLQIEDWVFWR
jgi:hypothetical protein